MSGSLSEQLQVKVKRFAERDEQKKKVGGDQFFYIQQNLESLFADIKVFIDEHGAKRFIQIDETNLAKVVSTDCLVSLAAPHFKKNAVEVHSKSLKEHVITWSDRSAGRLTTLPPSFSLDPDELTFNRISLDLAPGDCPTWDYFIGKCGTNGEALKAFIWSIFDRDCKSQQYLFLKGPGRDGKGSLIRWLDKLLNEQLVGLSAQDKYWPALCVGKRLGVFNDLNNTSVIMTSQFKQITGGDKVSIEQKYEKSFAVTLDTKFILTTNHSINVSSSDADRRRSILVELEPSDAQIEGYEELLAAETSAFLFKCREAYGMLYDKSRKAIACDYSFFESEASNFEESNDAVFENCFVVSAESYVSAAEFQTVLRNYKLSNQEISNFKDWLKRNHKVDRKHRVVDGSKQRIYPGITLKNWGFK